MSLQIKVKQGILQGKECTTYDGKRYYSFEGIPYAKPPVGQLRFRNPQEPENWSGVRDARKPGNKCPQLNPNGKKTNDESEDCLYLNIYTPSLPFEKNEKLPILFFIHGGRFVLGYGHYYKPDYFIRHDVILVTINYRLNIFGFLCLNIAEAPGNAGLKDTVMALRWVNNNIGNFNGDSNNVTVFGESAGSAICASYLTSKMADGLVNKIIMQSGNSISDLFMTNDDPVAKAKHIVSFLGQELNNERDLYDFLIRAPVDDLIFANAMAEISRPTGDVRAFLLPVVEKEFDGVERFIDEYPLVAIRENRFKKLPILTGLNSHEGAAFLRMDEHGNVIYEENFQVFVPRFTFLKENSPQALKLVKNIKEFYFKGAQINDNIKSEYVTFLSDAYFERDFLTFIDFMSKFWNNIYVYRFCYSGNMNTRITKKHGIKGATHGDLVQYQFYRKDKNEHSTENDRKIVDFITEAWSNFAKNGKPTWSNQQFVWAPYSHDKRYTLKISEDLKLEQDIGYERYNFWKNNLTERSKL